MGQGSVPERSTVARVDLHCHTTASFDGVADPVALGARAVARGLSHIAVTDHDTIDGAMRAAESAPAGLVVMIGSEVNTVEGDLIFVFLQRSLPANLSAREAIQAGREQGALVGIPHPYDRDRRSLLVDPANEEILELIDWIETWNARVALRTTNDRAVMEARRRGLPGVAVSDAHSLLEVGTAYTTLVGDPSTAEGLKSALRGDLLLRGPDPKKIVVG